jgi:glycosyltransferase involved in cell wall biosynthesis
LEIVRIVGNQCYYQRMPHPMNSPSQPAVLLVTPWYGGTHGGVAVATESLAHALIARGGTCVVLRSAPDGVMPRESAGLVGETIIDLCIRDETFATGNIRQRLGYAIRRRVLKRTLHRLIRKHHIEVVHFHFAILGYDSMMRVARQAGLRVVTTFHGADVNTTLSDPAARGLVRKMALLSDHVTVVSRTLHERLLAEVPEVLDRVSLVHNVVPTGFARTVDVPKAGNEPTVRHDILLVGQLIPRKGGDVLLSAFARVLEKLPRARVAFAGSGEFEAQLRLQAERLGIAGSVDFLGELSRAQLIDAYRETRVMVIPSRSEGLPLVLLEALWVGLPVVASAVDGLPEVIRDGENGLLVPSEDSDALAQALLRLLLDDQFRAALGTAARNDAHQRFAPAVMADKFAEVYTHLPSRGM